LITHQTMTDMEKLLPAGQFIRVHKSYIVAISHIRAIYGNSVEVNSITIPIGLSYKDKVMGLISGA
jgi:DNA-binding LytR/AlgR family response regulator